MRTSDDVFRRFTEGIGLITLLTLFLFGIRIALTGALSYWFIPENLFLAWLGLFFAWILCTQLEKVRWLSWPSIVLTFLWLVMLPNTWYVLTDFIHLTPSGEISELYDISMLSSLVFCGFILGFTSLYIVHRALRKRLSGPRSLLLIEIVILLSSFAIYVGRDLRWNSWDVLADPVGLLLNVSDRVVNPLANQKSFSLTALFFGLISVLYLAYYRIVSGLTPTKTNR